MRVQSTEDAELHRSHQVAEINGEQLEAFVQRVRGHPRPPFSHGFLLLDS